MMKTSKPLPSAIARHFSPTPPKFTHRLLTSTAGAQSTIRDWYAVQRNTRFHHQRGYATIVNDQPMNTGSSRFPFPPHPNPTAHEIFHLTSGASQGDIKKRCRLGTEFSNARRFDFYSIRLRAREISSPGLAPLSPPLSGEGPVSVSIHHSCLRLPARCQYVSPTEREAIWLHSWSIEFRSISA